MDLPLVDLGVQHRQIASEVADGFAAVIDNSSFVLGEETAAFEREFAAFSGVAHCVAVANGTDALELALRAAGIGPGDEVVVPTNTFIATAEAVVRAGATVVLVDSDPRYHLLDVDQVAERVGPRTGAVVPVHLFGQMAPVERLQSVLGTSGALLVEDAAQAQGASRNGTPAGRSGAAGATSFYPGKNLGAYGDGGAVLTESEDLARRLRSLRNHGQGARYHHDELGFNSRLDSLQAVVLRAKLRRLHDWNDQRRAAARRYDEMLAGMTDVTGPAVLDGNIHVWHLYVVRVPDRDRVLRRLNERGIGAGIHYPVPIHLQGAFGHLGHGAGDFPVAEASAAEILSLPIFPGITVDQQQRVVEELEKAVNAP